MGDRTTVRITVTKQNYDNLISTKFNGKRKDFEEETLPEYTEFFKRGNLGLVEMTASEINYADWGNLERLLKENKIEYDKSWDEGGNYEAGESFHRLIDNEMVEFEIYKSRSDEIDLLKSLLEYKGDLRTHITERLDQIDPKIEPLSEPNCVRFIKE